MKKNKIKKHSFQVFSSLEEENEAEYERRARMTPRQRLEEFAVLQERVWGTRWTKSRIKKIASIEKMPW